MWEIVICDSDKSFASKLENHVRNFYQDRKLETNVRIYTEGASFCRDLDDRKMDLIFLNTRLADVHGYEHSNSEIGIRRYFCASTAGLQICS